MELLGAKVQFGVSLDRVCYSPHQKKSTDWRAVPRARANVRVKMLKDVSRGWASSSVHGKRLLANNFVKSR